METKVSRRFAKQHSCPHCGNDTTVAPKSIARRNTNTDFVLTASELKSMTFDEVMAIVRKGEG